MRRITSVLALSASMVLLASAMAEAATAEKVRDDPGVDENSAAASPAYFAWSQNLASRPSQYNAYVRPVGGGSHKRVNPVGTRSYGVGIDGSLVVYQSTPRHGGNGNLRFYDAATQTRPSVPDGVNTPAFETRPTLSGDWLLFTRDNGVRTKVILFNVTTQEARVLRSGLSRTSYLVSDQVNGDWATFERCDFDRHTGKFSDCDVFRYTISTQELVKIENPRKQQYAAAISQDGTIYMVRTGGPSVWHCGQNTKIVRYPVGGPGTVIAKIGSDALTTFATDETDTSTTLYIDKFRCNGNTGGIYRIPNADSAT